MALSTFGCADPYQDKIHSVNFELFYKGKKASCIIEDFRFFISSVELNNQKVKLSDHPFQTSNISLLDFFTNRYCQRSVPLKLIPYNQSLYFSIPEKTENNKVDLSFNIGLPSTLNHQNPVKAKAPLNQSAMHWQWLSGYKFLRLEYEKNDQLNRFHLGSWGCSGKLPNNISCKEPNLIEINIKDFKLGESHIEIHLDSLLEIDSDSLCMGDPNDKACQYWINALQTDVFRLGKSKP